MSTKEFQAEAQLAQVYRTWLKELAQAAPDLMGAEYSNPYFISVPANWFETDGHRIMVVGEEGFGTWGCGKGNSEISADEVEKIQELNRQYLGKQLGLLPMNNGDKKNRSPFWKRFRQVSQYGVCCWSNIDKIHRLRERQCRLTAKERELLHSLQTKILQEEIRILQPTHVIFFGWYGVSLEHELPAVFAQLYPGGLGDKSVWDRKVVELSVDDIQYIFTYHPAWSNRNKWYEEAVHSAFNRQFSE